MGPLEGSIILCLDNPSPVDVTWDFPSGVGEAEYLEMPREPKGKQPAAENYCRLIKKRVLGRRKCLSGAPFVADANASGAQGGERGCLRGSSLPLGS